MKSYHLTQEHVLDLVKKLDKAGANLAALPEGGIEVLGIKGLQQLVNAAIDQVLGEPVAWAESGRENNVIADLVKQTNKNDWVKPYTVALYAPKEKL